MLDRRIPDCETEQRGHKSQKEQVARHDRIAEQCGVEPERREGENGQQGDNAVEEYFARDLERRVASVQLFQADVIERPCQCGSQREQIARRLYLQNEAPVEDDERDTGERQNRSGGKRASDSLAAAEP